MTVSGQISRTNFCLKTHEASTYHLALIGIAVLEKVFENGEGRMDISSSVSAGEVKYLATYKKTLKKFKDVL